LLKTIHNPTIRNSELKVWEIAFEISASAVLKYL
jgi:hypothetical protein